MEKRREREGEDFACVCFQKAYGYFSPALPPPPFSLSLFPVSVTPLKCLSAFLFRSASFWLLSESSSHGLLYTVSPYVTEHYYERVKRATVSRLR